MANNQCTTATVEFIGNGRREKITVEDGPYWTRYTGTAEQLIAIGLITHEVIPPGKKRVLYGAGGLGDSWCVRKARGGLVSITIWGLRRDPNSVLRPKRFTPDGFNRFLYSQVAPFLNTVWDMSRGMHEAVEYGKSTIRISARGMGKIGAAIDSILDAIKTDPLEVGDAYRPPLTVIRTDPTES